MQLKTRWLEVGLMICLSAQAFGAEGVDAAAPQAVTVDLDGLYSQAIDEMVRQDVDAAEALLLTLLDSNPGPEWEAKAQARLQEIENFRGWGPGGFTHNDTASRSSAEAIERGPLEISLMGGLTVLAEAGEDDPLGLIAFPFGGVYNAPLRGSYWLTDTLALQFAVGNRRFGDVAKEGEFYRTRDGSAFVSAGIQLSPQPQTQLLSPYLGLSLGTFYIRDGNKRGVSPFASLETGARLKLNDHAALRGQVALKPLIGPDNLGIYTTELGLGLSIFL